ncbi:MAG TPA: beta-ribofuranosylaminobenzene 5'-phosphate synthase family protein [Vicinamibacterales bacterium]
MTARVEEAVFVEAPARLHFGVLDLRGAMGRWFGGIGAAAPAPTLLVSASHADGLLVEGDEGERATEFARRLLMYLGGQRGMSLGARVRVHRALPSHAGLGSGTQLGLAIGRALMELHEADADAPTLARIMGRAKRSAIGTWTFAGGGLVVEGGRRVGQDESAPLLARLPFPPTWRCVVAVPNGRAGVSGVAESRALADLPSPPEGDVERVAYLVLMGLLPALVEADVESFGAALSEIQERTGRWFAPAQGGTFAPGPSATLVQQMTEWGARGVGQSSWGPAVYGIVEGEDAGARLAAQVRDALGPGGHVYEGPFRSDGARVWRAQIQS